MHLLKSARVIVLCLAVGSGLSAFAAEGNPSEQLAYLMHSQGVKKHLTENETQQIPGLQATAEAEAHKIGLGCEPSTKFQVQVNVAAEGTYSGYQVNLNCEDAPGTAVALYFDQTIRFLASIELGN